MPTKKPQYQVMPDCSEAEDEALEKDLKERGVIIPVVKTDTGDTVDGHRRERIAKKLGIKNVPTLNLSGLTPEEYRALALELNTNRRHLDRRAKEELVKQEVIRQPHLCSRRIAEQTGTSHPYVEKVRKRLIASGNVSRCETREGKQRRGCKRIYTYTASAQTQAQDFLQRHGEKLPTGHTSFGKIRRGRVEPPEPVLEEGKVRLYHCDFHDLPVKDGSLDICFCDPPYKKEWLPHWSELGEWASKKLKPSGVFACYYGVWHLPDVVASLGQSLTYHWNCVVKFKDNEVSPLYQKRVSSRYRGLLLYCKGKWRKDTPYIPDVFDENKKEKALHAYQQGQVGVQYYLNLLTEPGMTVCDPCMGSGTTGAAAIALKKGLQFIGCDIDKEVVGIARKRLGK